MLRRAVLPFLLIAVPGCGRTVSAEDCTQIRDNMRAAWAAEATKAVPANGAEKATAVLRTEGDRLVEEWMAECKKELMGRRADPKEMDCLLSAKTLGDINKCAGP
jgi:hypothetical protein